MNDVHCLPLNRMSGEEQRIAAPYSQDLRDRVLVAYDGAVNRDIFKALVEQVFVPELWPGDVVVMDNLSSHKGVRVRELIERAEAEVRYLPPCSPDLNPIELVLSKVKQRLRTLACRTVEALWSVMQTVLDAVTPTDAINGSRHAGYDAT